MNKSVLLATAVSCALIAGEASAAQPRIVVHGVKANPLVVPTKLKMLWDQNSNSNGSAVDSQNFTSNTSTASNNQGADDFVVPAGQKWKISVIDATGAYFNGSGPAASENVYFYEDNGGVPGNLVKHGSFTNVTGTDNGGSFSIKLHNKKMSLKPGTYWVSVVANCGSGCGEWGWEENGTIQGNEAMWQNPGGGFGVCSTWGTVGNCTGYGGDFMFDLQGHSEHK